MPFKTDAERLAPLLNPTYWEGLQPGVDLAPDMPTPPQIGKMSPRPKTALRDFVSNMHTYFAHNVYNPGDSFDASQQPDGTVVTFLEETLTTTAKGVAFIHQKHPEARQQKPKLRFTDLEPISRYTHRLDSLETTYTLGQRWGVIATQQRTQEKTLMSVQATQIDFDGGKFYSRPYFVPHAVRFILGKTFAYDGELGAPHDRETFIRVNKLHIAGYHPDNGDGGLGKKLRSLASFLIPNPGANPSKA